MQVIHLESFTPALDFGVLPHKQPSNVREEETPCGIVRISIGLAALVVQPVVSTPIYNGILTNELQIIMTIVDKKFY